MFELAVLAAVATVSWGLLVGSSGATVARAGGCSPTSECPPYCQRVKFTNAAGTAWRTFTVCSWPARGPVACAASGQASSVPQPGSVYLCRPR